ncbi:MAG TPA: NAD-dependent epimerase/dehydratase family protein [Sandaracinaceae bacterium]
MSFETAYRGKRALVTGGLGFLGSYVARALLDAGASVVVLDALIEGLGGDPAHLEPAPLLEIVHGDLRDEVALARAMEGADFVFHLAGASGHARSMDAPREDVALNVEATACLLSTWASRARHAPLVLASTRQIYGRALGPLDESHPVAPVDVNGVSKHACEQLLRVFERACGARGVALRLTNVYGPRMSLDEGRGHVLGAFLRRARAGQDLEVFSPGTDRRSFVHAEDVAAAFLAAASTEACAGKSFNVAGAPPISIRQLATIVARLAGVGVREVAPPPHLRAIDVGDHPLDDTAFRALTRWRPRWELEEGLRSTFEAIVR